MFEWLYWKLDNFLVYGRVQPFLLFADQVVEWVLSIGCLALIIIGPSYTLQFFGVMSAEEGLHFNILHYLVMGIGDALFLLALVRVIFFIKNHPERFGRDSW